MAVLLLGVVALSAWAALNRRMWARRRARRVLADLCRGGGPAALAGRVVTALRRLRRSPGGPRRHQLVLEFLLLPLGLGLGQLLRSPVPVLAAALAVIPLHRLRVRRATLREARGRAAAIIELCAALAGELRSGATPEQALEAVTGQGRSAGASAGRLGSEALARLAAARYGADVPDAFRRLAELPGGGGAAAIAACWQITVESGGGLAQGLDRVAEALRAERALEEEIQSELAGARTTAGLLAALPAFGLLLGGALGAQPVRVLLHTPVGLGCLGAGAVLEAVGLLWTARIVRGAQHLGGQADSGVGRSVRGRGRGRRFGAGVRRERERETGPGSGSRAGGGRGGTPWAGADPWGVTR